jgi:hypothetical protein
MLSKHEEQAERLNVIENEKRLRNQGTTFSQFAQTDAATSLGRFSAISNPVVVGEKQIPKYPAAYHQHDPVPDEPPLGVDINAIEPVGEKFEVEQSLSVDGQSPLELVSLPFSAQATGSEPLAEPGERNDASLPPGSVRSPTFSSRTYRKGPNDH